MNDNCDQMAVHIEPPFSFATRRVRVHGVAIGRECKVSDDVKEAE